jgi:hypothetical protein
MIAYPPERKNPTVPSRTLTLFGTLLLMITSTTQAQTSSSVSLAWNPVSAVGLAGYHLYQGTISGSYTNQIIVGNKTNATVSGLLTGVKYFFAVTAYTSDGMESPYSNEISYTPSTGPSIAPSSNPLPAIVLTAPMSSGNYIAPAQINIAASVTTNGHTINKVQFYNGGVLLAEDANPPYAFTWSNVGVGAYRLSTQVVFDSSNSISYAAVNVAVTAPPTSSLTFSSTSGTITAPFIASNGLIYQTNETSLTNSGRAAYPFNITAGGSYVISAMTIAPNNGANSFYLNVDAEPTDPTMIWDVPISTNLAQSPICWRGNTNTNGVPGADQFSPKIFNLAQGSHQLIVRGREANTQLGAITFSPTNAAAPSPPLHWWC